MHTWLGDPKKTEDQNMANGVRYLQAEADVVELLTEICRKVVECKVVHYGEGKSVFSMRIGSRRSNSPDTFFVRIWVSNKAKVLVDDSHMEFYGTNILHTRNVRINVVNPVERLFFFSSISANFTVKDPDMVYLDCSMTQSAARGLFALSTKLLLSNQ